MIPCTYSVNREPSSLMHAKQFGAFSMQWAVENSAKTAEAFKRPPMSEIVELKPFRDVWIYPHLFMASLQGAAYWIFAAALPQISGRIGVDRYTETLKLLKLGRDEYITTLRFPDGKPFTPKLAEFTRVLFARLYMSLEHDFQHQRSNDPSELNLNESETAKTFFALLNESLHIALEPHHRLVIGTFVDELALSTITAANTTMQIHC